MTVKNQNVMTSVAEVVYKQNANEPTENVGLIVPEVIWSEVTHATWRAPSDTWSHDTRSDSFDSIRRMKSLHRQRPAAANKEQTCHKTPIQ